VISMAGILAAGAAQSHGTHDKPKADKPAGGAKAEDALEKEAKIAIGNKVPDFTLKDSEGKDVNLSAYRGDGIVVLTFLSKTCPVSNALHPTLAELAEEYGPKGVRFLGIKSNVTEETPEVAAGVKAQGIQFPVLDDPGLKIADAMDALGTPHMYIVDKAGNLRYSGAVADNWKEISKAEKHFFEDALKAVIEGKPVADPNPNAFIGCTLKRSKKMS
jgi:peroxiredoxin